MRKLLEALARDRPLIVVLEDLDGPSRRSSTSSNMSSVSGRHRLPVAVGRPELLERRPAWTAPRPNSTLLVLHPLPQSASASLFDHLLEGADVRPEVRMRILEAAEGNPLFVEQMLAMSAESDLTASEDSPRSRHCLPPESTVWNRTSARWLSAPPSRARCSTAAGSPSWCRLMPGRLSGHLLSRSQRLDPAA